MAHRDGITTRTTAAGETRYCVRWFETDRDGHRARRAKTFPTRDKAAAFLRARERGAVPPATMTVNDLIAETLDRAADRLSPRTILTYRKRAESMIAPYIGERRVIDLATIDVQRWIDQLGRERDGGEPAYKPATIHAAVAVLFGALRDAHLLGMIDRNVAVGIRRPRIRPAKMTTWTIDEMRRFLAHVRDDARYGVMWHVALATGMRPGELRALKWSDIDLDAGTIRVQRTISKGADGREVISDGTKRGQSRVVAIPAPLVAMIRRHKVAQAARHLKHAAWQDFGIVFDRGDGHWIRQSKWRDAQVAACRAAGVPYLTAHQLRHQVATSMLERGVNVKIVSEMLGHQAIQTTMDVYQHVGIDLQRAVADGIGAALFDPAANDE